MYNILHNKKSVCIIKKNYKLVYKILRLNLNNNYNNKKLKFPKILLKWHY